MLGLAAFLDYKNGPKTAQGIMWFGLGAVVGWPFAGALILPMILEEIVICFFAGSLGSLFYMIFDGALRCLAIVVSFKCQLTFTPDLY
jgi:alpha-1,2-mannosyltransferase